jgi:hypothetical protein
MSPNHWMLIYGVLLPQAAHQVNDWSVAKFSFENRREVPREAVYP